VDGDRTEVAGVDAGGAVAGDEGKSRRDLAAEGKRAWERTTTNVLGGDGAADLIVDHVEAAVGTNAIPGDGDDALEEVATRWEVCPLCDQSSDGGRGRYIDSGSA
jgi:hypothetical protein